jgi:hypothetical protein
LGYHPVLALSEDIWSVFALAFAASTMGTATVAAITRRQSRARTP